MTKFAATIEPVETGFDGRLRALAATILDEEAPNLNGPFGRDDLREELFQAMQAYAELRALHGSPNDMAACETLGRTKVRLRVQVI